MIQGPARTEATYRAVGLDSSSSLKEFSLNRKKYYKKYILNEKVEDEDNKATVMGRLVETLLMEPELFDDKFHMSIVASAPTGLMLEFVEALYKHTVEATNESGEITRSFEELCRDAYADSGFKIKIDAVMGKFVGSDAEVYYQEIRTVRSRGLTVVTTADVQSAENIVQELRMNPITAEIVNMVPSGRFSVYNQLQVENYEVDGHHFKSMMDKVIVDHEGKFIQVYDLKCTWAVEGFYEEYYLYRRAYIQAYLYFYAALHHFSDLVQNEGYVVLDPIFIVCDSTNYSSPLLYSMTPVAMDNAYNGFIHRGRTYPGVKSIIEDLKWSIENNIWNISRENYLNYGVVKL